MIFRIIYIIYFPYINKNIIPLEPRTGLTSNQALNLSPLCKGLLKRKLQIRTMKGPCRALFVRQSPRKSHFVLAAIDSIQVGGVSWRANTILCLDDHRFFSLFYKKTCLSFFLLQYVFNL